MTELLLILFYLIIAAMSYVRAVPTCDKFDVESFIKSLCWPFFAILAYFRCLDRKDSK